MGSIPSQLNMPKLTVVNKLPENKNKIKPEADDETQSESKPVLGLESEKTSLKILVSIVDKTTVVIAEGKSIGTQTREDDVEYTTRVIGSTAETKSETLPVLPDRSTPPDDTREEPVRDNGKPPESQTLNASIQTETDNNENDANETKERGEKSGESSIKEDNGNIISNSYNDDDSKEKAEEKNDRIREKQAAKTAWQEEAKLLFEDTDLENTDIDTREEPETEMNIENDNLHGTPSLSPPPILPFEEMSLNRYGRYNIRVQNDTEKCIISAALFMENGDAVLIDRSNQKLKYVDAKFQFISTHQLAAKPWAVCSRKQGVYITLGNTQIQHFDVENMVIEPGHIFEIKGRCLGICVLEDFLAVGLQVGEILLLDFKGESTENIQLPELRMGKSVNPWHLTATSECNLLVTDSDAGAVFCINKKSELIFIYKGLSSPRATAVDYHGNIIVVGRDNITGAVVTILEKDMELQNMLHIQETPREKQRILMTWNNLEFVPYCVSYRTDNVVVLGGIQEALKIMKLGWKETCSEDDEEEDDDDNDEADVETKPSPPEN